METRALCIAFFYAIGTAVGGITGPLLFGKLIDNASRDKDITAIAIGYFIGAALMIAGGLVEVFLGRQGRGRVPGEHRQAAHRRGGRLTQNVGVDLTQEGDRLLEFGRASRHPDGGFAWLSVPGRPHLDRPVELWITCRMTHVYALGHLLGRPGLRVAGRPRDRRAAPVGSATTRTVAGTPRSVADGPVTTSKTAYEHAFVVLAAAIAAGRRASRCPRAARRGADRPARPLLGRRARHGRGGVGRVLVDARRLPRRQRQHAHRRGAARGRRRARRPVPARPGAADHHPGGPRARARARLADPGALRRRVEPAAGVQRRRAGPRVPSLRRHDRPLAGVGPPRPAPPGRARARRLLPGCCPTRSRCSTRRCARAGRSTAPTGSSTPSTGPAAPSYASGCTGSPPRPPPPPPPCTGRPATRRTPTGTPPGGSTSTATSATPSHGSWHHELSPDLPPERRHVGRQARHLPRLPGHPAPAPPARPDPRPRSPLADGLLAHRGESTTTVTTAG